MKYLQTHLFALLSIVSILFSCPLYAATDGGIDRDTNTVTLVLGQEPRSFNSLTAESVSYTAQLMAHIHEGLMRYNGRRKLVGGVAERWEVDSHSMRFWLRPDAKWQDGRAVTAADFVFAWQQLVNPKTGAPSANLASPIKNASKILRGELPATQLGVSAPGPRELLVELEHPCGWCLKLMTNSMFYPIKAEFYEANGEAYGTSKAQHMANGAFQISKWQRGKRIFLEKNPQYWGNERVFLDNIHFDYAASDIRTGLNLFRAGDVAAANLDRDTIPEAIEFGYRVKTYPSGHLFHIQFSHLPGKLSANEDIRRAIAYVINKDELINRVVASPGTRRADSMFHDWLTVGNAKYISERPPAKQVQDIDKARFHLARARETLGLTEPISLTLTINDSELYLRIAEYLQQELKTYLDIDLAIDPQLTQIMVDKWRKGESDMVLLTWPVDVDDPMDQISFMGNPDFRAVFKGLYAGHDMAQLYLNNRDAIGQEARLDAVEQVQNLFANKVTVLPLFESYGAVTINPNLRGFVWQPVRGYADYRYARIKPASGAKK